jgi:hypothetical protein
MKRALKQLKEGEFGQRTLAYFDAQQYIRRKLHVPVHLS